MGTFEKIGIGILVWSVIYFGGHIIWAIVR